MDIRPITLNGNWVQLEPISVQHVADLAIVGSDDSIWQFMRYGAINSLDSMHEWVQQLLELQVRGTDLPFAVIHNGNGRAIGATRYLDISRENRSLEIGGTWYGARYQQTAVNTECKYLLLKHAFETLGCIRVQFKTDLRNERSQRALERIGAVKEGVLRNHMILPDGTIRHSVYYSIINTEWLDVKASLEDKLKG